MERWLRDVGLQQDGAAIMMAAGLAQPYSGGGGAGLVRRGSLEIRTRLVGANHAFPIFPAFLYNRRFPLYGANYALDSFKKA